jgi:hypothetical protein
MKKLAFLAIIILALFIASSRELEARANLRFGIVTDKSFSFDPFYWTVGLDYDIKLVHLLFLDPEIYMIVPNFDFGMIRVAPGVLLNYIVPLDGLHTLWFGGGVTKWEWWRLGSDVAASPSSGVALKLNASLITNGVTITLFVITPFNNIFQDMTLGAVMAF